MAITDTLAMATWDRILITTPILVIVMDTETADILEATTDHRTRGLTGEGMMLTDLQIGALS